MLLTKSQFGLYTKLWNAVLAESPGLDRVAFHRQHKLPDSRKDWDQDHFTTFKAACLAITEPDHIAPQLAALQQPRTRLEHRIEDQIKVLAFLLGRGHVKYFAAILHDRFHARTMDDLGDQDLEHLRYTLAARLGPLRAQYNSTRALFENGPLTEHELYRAAGADCPRRDCAQCRKEKLTTETQRTQSPQAEPFSSGAKPEEKTSVPSVPPPSVPLC